MAKRRKITKKNMKKHPKLAIAKADKQPKAETKAQVETPPAPVAPAPVSAQRMVPAMRHLVLETDGDTIFLRANTMGLIELSRCLQMLTRQTDAAIDRKAGPQPPAPEAAPEPPEPAAEPKPEDKDNAE